MLVQDGFRIIQRGTNWDVMGFPGQTSLMGMSVRVSEAEVAVGEVPTSFLFLVTGTPSR